MPNRWIGFSMWKYLCKTSRTKESFMKILTLLCITLFFTLFYLWTCVGISLSQNRCCHTACLLHIVPRGRATCSSLWLHEQIAITGNWDCGRARRHFGKCWIGIDSGGSSEGETWGRASACGEKRRQKRQCWRGSSIPWCLKQACQCLWRTHQAMNSARGLNTQIWPWEGYMRRKLADEIDRWTMKDFTDVAYTLHSKCCTEYVFKLLGFTEMRDKGCAIFTCAPALKTLSVSFSLFPLPPRCQHALLLSFH